MFRLRSRSVQSHLQCDFAVVIDIKNPKYLLQILLWSPIGHDVENYHKLTKVNVSILKIRWLVINCFMTLFWYHLIEPHNRILKQSLIYFVIARYKERNMRILLWSLIKFLLHQHCLKFSTFIFVTTDPSPASLYLVWVVHSEDVFLKFFSVSSRVTFLHHRVKRFFRNSAVRMHFKEVLILGLE